MQRRILVPLNGYSSAEAILPQALAMARGAAAPYALTLLHVLPAPWLAVGNDYVHGLARDTWEEDHAQAVDYLGHLAARLATEGIDVDTEVMEGPASAQIIARATQDADVVGLAMAYRAHHNAFFQYFGCTAGQVARALSKPLLLMQAPHQQNNLMSSTGLARRGMPKKVLVSLDRPLGGEVAVSRALRMVSALGGTLVLVAAVAAPKEAILNETSSCVHGTMGTLAQAREIVRELAGERMEEMGWQDGTGFTMRRKTMTGTPVEALLHAYEEERPDLVVVATHTTRGLQLFRSVSAVRQITTDSGTPLLLVPENSSQH